MSRIAASWPRLGPAATIVLALLATYGARLAAQATTGGSTPEDSVRAVELARGHRGLASLPTLP